MKQFDSGFETYFGPYAQGAIANQQREFGSNGIGIEVISANDTVNILRGILAPGKGYNDRHVSFLLSLPKEEFEDRYVQIRTIVEGMTDEELAGVYFDEALRAGSTDDYSDWCILDQLISPEVRVRNYRLGIATVGSLATEQYDLLVTQGTNPRDAYTVVRYDNM
jgi:hypothetical protein